MSLSARQGGQPAYQAALELTREVVQRFHPDRVVLFGSSAKFKEQAGSDIDLLVVFNDLAREDKRRRAQDLYAAFWNAPLPVDFVVANAEDLRLRGDQLGLIYRPALREGVTLYERE